MITLDISDVVFRPEITFLNLDRALAHPQSPNLNDTKPAPTLELADPVSQSAADGAQLIELLSNHAGVGLWNAHLYDADPMHAHSHWQWSSEYRRLLGFEGASEFPDLIFSWADRLHPDDTDRTFKALYAALGDYTGRTPYDVTYRLKTKDHSYRWYRSVAGVARDRSGKAILACGSLIDINEAKTAELFRRQSLQQLANIFDARVFHLVKLVFSSSAGLQASSQDLSFTITQAASQASLAAVAVEQSSAEMQSAGESTRQLTAVIGEVAGQVSELAQVNSAASHQCEVVSELVHNLSIAASRLGEAVKLVNAIGAQTNLLALSTTIEAARAGDAGAGFALAAGEMKELAAQTARAAQDISVQISAVQNAARVAIDGMEQITPAVGNARDFSAGVVTSVESQAAKVQRIASVIEQSMERARQASRAICGVGQAAKDLDAGSGSVLQAAGELSTQADRLRSEATFFFRAVLAP